MEALRATARALAVWSKEKKEQGKAMSVGGREDSAKGTAPEAQGRPQQGESSCFHQPQCESTPAL